MENKDSSIVLFGIFALILFTPLPIGSVHEWSILIIALAVLTLLAVFIVQGKKHSLPGDLARSLVRPRLLFSYLFLFFLFQLIPLPVFLVKMISPQAYGLRELITSGLKVSPFISLSVVPSNTLIEILKLLSFFILGFLVIQVVRHKRQMYQLFYLIIVMGVFEAFYGIYELASSSPRVLFYQKVYDLDSASGSFVNRNHFSGYLEMIIPLAIGLLIARVSFLSTTGMKWKEKLLRLADKGLALNLFLIFSVIIMSLAVILSKSRSGLSILTFCFFSMLGLSILYIRWPAYHKRSLFRVFQVVFACVLIIALLVGMDATLERFALDDLLEENRPSVWINTLHICEDFPLFGTGLGNFAALYPVYEISPHSGRYYHAHNDYLEYLSELGLIGFLLLVLGIGYMLIKSFRVWKERRHPEIKGMALGGIVSIAGILLHSLTDFNLHIPSNLLLFTVILCLTFNMVFYNRRRRPRKKTTQEDV